MKTIASIFYNKKLVIYLFILYLIIGITLLFMYEKKTFHLLINQYHNSFFDVFFKYATYLGDGIIFPIVIVGLLVFQRKYATAFIISGLLTLVLSYVLKNWVFVDFARPYEVFGDQLHLVEGVKMRHWHSFPSGHTTAAFSLFMLVVLYIKKTRWQLFFLTLALVAGLSRIYLSQHFLQDVLAGSVIGTGIAIASYQLTQNYSFFKK